MEIHKRSSLQNLAIVCLLLSLSGVIYICLWSPSISLPFSLSREINCSSSNSTQERIEFQKDEIELALEKASMANKTVIIAVVNKAYVEQTVETEMTMLDLFLEGLWIGEETRPLLEHVLVVAVDQTAYDRCRFKRLNCYRLETEGVDFGGEKVFMSPDFINMMWARTLFLLDVLNRGYNFIFTDTDIIWLRNPFSHLSKNETMDVQISVDMRNTKQINTGFYYAKSNNKTISLFKKWYERRENSTGMKEQDVLTGLLKEGVFNQLGLSFKLLDTLHFSGFCQDSTNIKKVVTVHANCCRHIGAKLHDLTRVLREWKQFKASPSTGIDFRWSPHTQCWKSWNDTKYRPMS